MALNKKKKYKIKKKNIFCSSEDRVQNIRFFALKIKSFYYKYALIDFLFLSCGYESRESRTLTDTYKTNHG